MASVKSKQFNMALQRMTRRVQEAALGTGEAKQAIADLGLDATKLAKLDPGKMLIQFMDALRGRTDRLQKAFKLFDSEGVVMLQVFDLGKKRIREFMEFAARAGVLLSRFDISMIQAANDAVLKTKTAVQGLVNQLAVALAPIVKKIADMVTSFLLKIDKGKLRGFFVSMFEVGVVAAGEFLKLLGRIPEVFLDLKAEILEFGHLVKKAFDPESEVKGLFSAHSVVVAQAAAGLARLKRGIRDVAIDKGVESLFERLGLVRQEGGAGKAMAIIADLFRGGARDALKDYMRGVGKLFNVQQWQPFFNAFKKQVIDPWFKGLRYGVNVRQAAPRVAGELRQISPSRFYIAGLAKLQAREQRVRDPQIPEVITVLRAIERKENVAVFG